METIITIIFAISWGFLCYLMGRFSSVNKALTKQWGDQREFNEWKQKNTNLAETTTNNGRK